MSPTRTGGWSRGLRGFIQGYDAQIVTNEQQIVIAAEVMTAAPDFGHPEAMLDAARRQLTAAGVTDTPEVMLGDAGSWHQQQMQSIMEGGYYAFMRRVLASDLGGAL